MHKLEDAIAVSTDLDDLQKQIGKDVIGHLKQGFKSHPAQTHMMKMGNNFVDYILPAIALQYDKRVREGQGLDYDDYAGRHYENVSLKKEDFINGLEFGRKNGMFFHYVEGHAENSEVRRFTCPAAKFVMDSMGNAATAGEHPGSPGSALYNIYKLIEEKMKSVEASELPAVSAAKEVIEETYQPLEIRMLRLMRAGNSTRSIP